MEQFNHKGLIAVSEVRQENTLRIVSTCKYIFLQQIYTFKALKCSNKIAFCLIITQVKIL